MFGGALDKRKASGKPHKQVTGYSSSGVHSPDNAALAMSNVVSAPSSTKNTRMAFKFEGILSNNNKKGGAGGKEHNNNALIMGDL
jgi:hypothetical protein